jgi:hypothetical protein
MLKKTKSIYKCLTVIKKIRDFGDYPGYKDSGDEHYCEICRESGYLEKELKQCPECGRWVCDSCWDKENAVCEICAKSLQFSKDLDKDYASRIDKLEKNLKELKTMVIDLNVKLENIKFCPQCNAPAPKIAKYCGICGKEF